MPKNTLLALGILTVWSGVTALIPGIFPQIGQDPTPFVAAFATCLAIFAFAYIVDFVFMLMGRAEEVKVGSEWDEFRESVRKYGFHSQRENNFNKHNGNLVAAHNRFNCILVARSHTDQYGRKTVTQSVLYAATPNLGMGDRKRILKILKGCEVTDSDPIKFKCVCDNPLRRLDQIRRKVALVHWNDPEWLVDISSPLADEEKRAANWHWFLADAEPWVKNFVGYDQGDVVRRAFDSKPQFNRQPQKRA